MRAQSNLLLFIFITIGTVAFSQHQSYNYYIAFSGKYFKSDGKNGVQRGFDSKFIHPEVFDYLQGYATISDKSGNLLFYSDGFSIYNSSNNKLSGSLNKRDQIKQAEKVLFRISGSSQNFCLVTQSNYKIYIQLFNEFGVYKHDSSINEFQIDGFPGIMNHCSILGNWILVKEKDKNTFRSYYLDSSGIKNEPVLSTVTSISNLKFPNMIYAPNSKEFVIVSSKTGLNSPLDFDLFTFNQENGLVAHKKKLFSNVGIEVTKELKINLSFVSFSPKTNYIYFFGLFLPNETDKFSNSGTAIFRYDILKGNLEFVFKSGPKTIIYPREFNLINPNQLVYVINSGFTRAEVGYGYSPSSRLFSIENSDASNSKDIIFKDFIVSPDTLAYDVMNGVPSQNSPHVIQSKITKTIVCLPEKSKLEIQSNIPIYDVKWDLGDGTFLSGSSSISHAYAKPGVYFVKALVKLCGQVDTLLDTLVVEQKPDLSYLRDTSICEGNSVQFMRPANHPGIWNNTDTNSVFVCNQEGKYSFTVENSCGLFTQTFEVKTVKPFLQNPPQELISCGNFPQLKTTQLANKYLWNTGATSPEILADTPGLYVLKLANNCFTGTEEFLVKNPAQQSNIVLPNAITTNADGLNENWQPIITGIQRFTYSIYSRWGDLIFSGNEQNPVWYPNANNSGVYLVELAYQPDCKEIQHKKGTITIIK